MVSGVKRGQILRDGRIIECVNNGNRLPSSIPRYPVERDRIDAIVVADLRWRDAGGVGRGGLIDVGAMIDVESRRRPFRSGQMQRLDGGYFRFERCKICR